MCRLGSVSYTHLDVYKRQTIVNLLMRFYELDSGEILLDDIPISQVPRENVHEQFGMVLQDTWMFEGTIKENIICLLYTSRCV